MKYFTILTDEGPMFDTGASKWFFLEQHLIDKGVTFQKVEGFYVNAHNKKAKENAFLISYSDTQAAKMQKQCESLARQLGQEAVLHIENASRAILSYVNGSDNNKWHVSRSIEYWDYQPPLDRGFTKIDNTFLVVTF